MGAHTLVPCLLYQAKCSASKEYCGPWEHELMVSSPEGSSSKQETRSVNSLCLNFSGMFGKIHMISEPLRSRISTGSLQQLYKNSISLLRVDVKSTHVDMVGAIFTYLLSLLMREPSSYMVES